MRIIAGRAKGHSLVAPKGTTTRPALDRVKESVFAILFNITDDSVLDLFAGTGSMGLEAISRGAKNCVFVERDRAALESLLKNIEHCKFKNESIVLKSDVERSLEKDLNGQSFDLIFCDPPYLKNLVNPSLKLIAKHLKLPESCRIVVEHHPKEPIGEIPGLALTDQRTYGQTLISFLAPQV